MSAARRLPSPTLLARLVRRLGPHLSRQRGRFAIAFLGTLGGIAGELLEPWSLKVVVDHVLSGKPAPWLPEWLAGDTHRMRLLWASAGAMLAIALFNGICAFVRELFGAAAGQRVVMGVREMVHSHVQKLSIDYHLSARHGDLLLRLTGDLTLVRELLVDALLEMARHALLLVGMAVVLVAVSPKLGLAALAVVPLLALLQQLFHRRIASAAAKQRENEAKLAADAGEMLAAINLVHAYQLESHLTEAFHARNRKSLKSGLAGTKLQARLSRSLEIALAAGLAVTLLLGSREVLAGSMTLGSLIVILAYVRSTYKPLRQLSQRAARASKAAGAATRLLELLDIEPTVVERPDAVALPTSGVPSLEFEHVTVSFDKGRAALRDVSLDVAPGRKVLLLGPNGAGKSTLLSLVPRRRDPAAGSVRLGGRDVRELTLASLRSVVGLLPQETALLSGTIADNLRLGRLGADDAEIEEAARLAGLERAFPDARSMAAILTQRVGEGGRMLSGGQRQRVALGRLLLRRPRIVLLDEPETAVDARSRGALLRDLLAALPGATVLVVTHHLSAPDLFDEAVVLDGGSIAMRAPVDRILRDRPDLFRTDAFEESAP